MEGPHFGALLFPILRLVRANLVRESKAQKESWNVDEKGHCQEGSFGWPDVLCVTMNYQSVPSGPTLLGFPASRIVAGRRRRPKRHTRH